MHSLVDLLHLGSNIGCYTVKIIRLDMLYLFIVCCIGGRGVQPNREGRN